MAPAKKRSLKKPIVFQRKRRSSTLKLEVDLLKDLLKARPGYLNGSDFAEKNGVSKVSVWSRLKKLERDGIHILSRKNRGYSFQREPNYLHGEFLEALLPDSWRSSVFHHEEVGSTNAFANKLLAQGRDAPFIVTANKQSHGRGRMGNSWASRDMRNLYISFAYRPDCRLKLLETFTLFVGLELCRFLNQKTEVEIKLKWPNDLYIGDLKVAGMLAESRIESDRVKDLVFGFGLNVNGTKKALPTGLANKATTLAHEKGEKIKINELTADIIKVVDRCYHQCLEDDFSWDKRDWSKYDYLLGKHVSLNVGKQKIDGECDGINDKGELLIRSKDGKLSRCRAGEVSLSGALK